MMLIPLTMCAAPRPRGPKIKAKHVKAAVQHARNLCLNYEDTTECRVAWGYASEIEKAFSKQKERERKAAAELIWFSDIETREYDL